MDVTRFLDKDHQTVDRLFRNLQRVFGSPEVNQDHARELLRELTRELSSHAAAEEQVLYPLVRSQLPDGARLADEALKEHQAAKELLSILSSTPIDDPELRNRLDSLAADVRHHVAKEEGEIVAKLRGWLGRERLAEVGEALERAKQFAPTRPHPALPNRPPANFVTGIAAAAVDRVLDVADQGRALAGGAAGAALESARGALGRRASTLRKSAERAGRRMQDRVSDVVDEGRERAGELAGAAGLGAERRRPRKRAKGAPAKARKRAGGSAKSAAKRAKPPGKSASAVPARTAAGRRATGARKTARARQTGRKRVSR